MDSASQHALCGSVGILLRRRLNRAFNLSSSPVAAGDAGWLVYVLINVICLSDALNRYLAEQLG